MMSDETARLDDQLRRVLEGESWHGPAVLELLEGVSAPQAASHPIPGAHSIWELVLHITTDYVLLVRRLAGDGRALTDEEGWPACPPPTEEHWRETVETLRLSNLQLRDAVRALPPERLHEPLVGGMSSTAYVQLLGVTQHNLYHAGQIALLKRAIAHGARPADRG